MLVELIKATTGSRRLSKEKRETRKDGSMPNNFSISALSLSGSSNRANTSRNHEGATRKKGNQRKLKDLDHNIKTTLLNINRNELLAHQPDLICLPCPHLHINNPSCTKNEGQLRDKPLRPLAPTNS